MSIEARIFSALRGLVADRVYPDPPDPMPQRPYIVHQRLPGVAINFLDGSVPGKDNGRFQINCWCDTRVDAIALMHQVESAMRLAASLQTTVLGSPASLYEPDTKLRGAMQDFSCWS